MKFHKWTSNDDEKLIKAIDECQPLFEHFKDQGKTYSDKNAWDAVAGRLLPLIVVTGAACRRRFEIIKEDESKDKYWDKVIEQVETYERELAETTFDGVSEILGNMDALFDEVSRIREDVDRIRSDVDQLKKLWQ